MASARSRGSRRTGRFACGTAARTPTRIRHTNSSRARCSRSSDRGDLFEAKPAPEVNHVVIRYSQPAGVLLAGATKPNKAAIKALTVPYRFRYSPNLPDGAAWYVPRTRGTVQSREHVERNRGGAASPGRVGSRRLHRTIERGRVDHRTRRGCGVATEARTAHPTTTKRAAKLRELADKMEAAAVAEIGAVRNENTHRRASMASSARGRARQKGSTRQDHPAFCRCGRAG